MLPNHFFPAKAVRAVKEARACPVPVRAVWALPATVRTELGTHDAKLPYFYEPYGLSGSLSIGFVRVHGYLDHRIFTSAPTTTFISRLAKA